MFPHGAVAGSAHCDVEQVCVPHGAVAGSAHCDVEQVCVPHGAVAGSAHCDVEHVCSPMELLLAPPTAMLSKCTFPVLEPIVSHRVRLIDWTNF